MILINYNKKKKLKEMIYLVTSTGKIPTVPIPVTGNMSASSLTVTNKQSNTSNPKQQEQVNNDSNNKCKWTRRAGTIIPQRLRPQRRPHSQMQVKAMTKVSSSAGFTTSKRPQLGPFDTDRCVWGGFFPIQPTETLIYCLFMLSLSRHVSCNQDSSEG